MSNPSEPDKPSISAGVLLVGFFAVVMLVLIALAFGLPSV